MVVLFCTNLKCNKFVVWCARRGLATCDEVGTWSSDSVLDQVGNEECKDERYEPSKDRDVRFVSSGLKDKGPYNEYAEGYCACVDEEPRCRYISASPPISALYVQYVLTETRSISACGYCIFRLSSENMRWKGSPKNWICDK